MVNRVVYLTPRQDIEEELQVVDYVSQRTDKTQRAEFESRLLKDKNLQHQVTEEIELSHLIRDAYPEQQISNAAFSQFTDSLEQNTYHSSRFNHFRQYFHLVGVTAVLLITVVVIRFLTIPQGNEFEVLSNEKMQLIANPDGLLYTLIFDKNTTQQEQLILTQTLGFEILANSTATNTMLVKVDKKLSDNELEQRRKIPQIVFLESAVTRNRK